MANQPSPLSESLRRAHAALVQDLQKLEELARPGALEGLMELAACLKKTSKTLAEHFRFEEQNGYMDAVKAREPRMERRIQELAEQHGALAGSLDGLVKEAREVLKANASWQEKVRAWVKRIQRHELKENKLVQEAFDFDIGAED